MTIRVTSKHCCKETMTCVTIETFKTPLIDIFKLKNGLVPPIMGSMFKWGNMTYNLRKF